MAPTDPRILAQHKASWDFADGWGNEDEARETARLKAADVGCHTVSIGTGAVLRMLATASDARSVVEIGTGAGVSALWLLDGMHADGVVTSIDTEAEHQLIAREAVSAAGINPNRVRFINGKASDVMSRLADASYDIALVNVKPSDVDSTVERCVSLLRPGGYLVIDEALWQDKLADPSQRDADTMAMRAAVNSIASRDELAGALLPIGGGLLVAAKRHSN